MGLRLRRYIQLRDFASGAIAHRGRSLISTIALFVLWHVLRTRQPHRHSSTAMCFFPGHHAVERSSRTLRWASNDGVIALSFVSRTSVAVHWHVINWVTSINHTADSRRSIYARPSRRKSCFCVQTVSWLQPPNRAPFTKRSCCSLAYMQLWSHQSALSNKSSRLVTKLRQWRRGNPQFNSLECYHYDTIVKHADDNKPS